ncbi:hypothetical protein EX895_003954 [Sporisorium graminicola]|uniref:Uncharacterized protein n=1 Tax=Sporisorium graminicola TaxID=280036 RepID=A0A4U7KTA0_9BASI|nr:hypothetical protein EX895_003954 [Sporisorium graminicola]TKY87277.1 hypothetical protein EX895_003954 [Sporisorium graminicola]
MSIQPYSLAFHHALELDTFLKEANITTTDLFAVLGHERYRKRLMGGIKTIVDDYKEQGRDPPPVNLMPILRPQQSRRPFVQTIPQPSVAVPLAIRHVEHGLKPSRVQAGPLQSSRGLSTLGNSQSASAPSARVIQVQAARGPDIEAMQDFVEDGGDTTHIAGQRPSRELVDRSLQPSPAPGKYETPMEFVPGTKVKVSSLSAPQAWTYLHSHPAEGSGMSFVARITLYSETEWIERVATLDFGNDDAAVLLVAKTAPAGLHASMESRFKVGSFVYVQNVTRLIRNGSYFLRFGSCSSIDRLEHVTQASMAAVNAQCNRVRKRKYDDVVEVC